MSRDTYRKLTPQARVQRGAFLALAKLPGPILDLARRWAPVNSDGEQVAPELAALGRLNELPGMSPFSGEVETSRINTDAGGVAMAEVLPPMAVEEDLAIEGPGGAIGATRYRSSTTSSGLILYFHGGGFITGSRVSHDTFARRLAHGTGLDVLSVDYRLAPDHPFPAAVEDAVAAWRFAVEAAPRWDIDPARIVVAGDSAGGNLATVLALQVRGEAVTPMLQLLLYPITDMSTVHPSRREFAHGYFLTADGLAWIEGHFVTDPAQRTDPRCSPLLADDLSGLPPAHVVVAGFDPLRDEGIAYARRLEDAGVPVTLEREGAMIHAFVNMTLISRGAREAADRICAAVRTHTG